MVYESLGDLDQAIAYVSRCVALKEAIGIPVQHNRDVLKRLKARRDRSG